MHASIKFYTMISVSMIIHGGPIVLFQKPIKPAQIMPKALRHINGGFFIVQMQKFQHPINENTCRTDTFMNIEELTK